MTVSMSAELKAHGAQGSTNMTVCWKATLRNGTVHAATKHDQDIVYDGTVYLSSASFNQTEVTNTSDLSVDNLEVEGILVSPMITEADIVAGLWDYAEVEIFRVNYNDLSQGRRMIRKGTLGEVRAGRTRFNAELRGLLQKLSKHIIKITTKDCINDLGDSKCQVNLAAITVTGTVTAVASNREFTDSSRTEEADWFTGGLLTWVTGLNAGLQMEVRRSTAAGVFELHQSMPYAIQETDEFTVYAGCLKRFTEDCKGKHNNGPRFGGFPHVPQTDAYKRPVQ